jgi:hypothetical protein
MFYLWTFLENIESSCAIKIEQSAGILLLDYVFNYNRKYPL